LGKASINITAATTKSKEEDTTSKKTAGTPLAVTISSPTHPDPEKWYTNNNPKFEWAMAKDITAINVLVDKNPDTNPGTKSDGLSNSYDFENVDDGVWYFHLRLKNSSGWGEVSHFKFQIDKKALEYLNITEVKEEGNILSQAKFSFVVSETISGIDYYEIKIDDGEKEIWRQKADELYVTTAIGAGEHELFVTAFNKAGNSIKNSAKFSIEASVAPEIIGYFCDQSDNKISTIENDQVFVKTNCVLYSGDTLIIKGKSNYPGQQVIVYLQKDDEEVITATIKSDRQGNFIFVANDKLKNGVYKVWAEAIGENNIKSAESKKVSITVKRYILPKILLAMDIFVMSSSFIIFIAFFIIILWYICHKFCIFRKKAKKEDYEVEHELYKSSVLFKKDANEQIEKLEKTRTKRRLTKEEEKLLNSLKKN
jgi:lipopolysaccharide export system protein LptA